VALAWGVLAVAPAFGLAARLPASVEAPPAVETRRRPPQPAKVAETSPAVRPPAPSSPKTPAKARVAPRSASRETSAQRHVFVGLASWYGPGFHGKRTASGEPFRREALTLAHRRLPFGSRVRVTNMATGKSVIARVNDRGPFHAGRVADLGEGTARKVGLRGVARVRLEVLPAAQ